MSDIVERLRDRAYSFRIVDRLCEEAADEIARLRITAAEREAVLDAALAYESDPDECECAKIAATLRGLLERLKHPANTQDQRRRREDEP